MPHPTFIGNQKKSFFPICATRRRNTSKLACTNAITSLPLWFHVMECLEMKSRQHSTTKPCKRILAKKPGKSYSETSKFMKSRMSCVIVRATHQCMHPRITHPHYEPNASPVGRWRPASACSTIKRTTNRSQTWAKVFKQQISNWTPEININIYIPRHPISIISEPPLFVRKFRFVSLWRHQLRFVRNWSD